MKQFILVTFFCAFSFFMGAQEKAALTKQETVDYIQKKMNEVLQNTFIENSDPKKHYCWKQSISLSEDAITVNHVVNNDPKEFGTWEQARWSAEYGSKRRLYDCGYKKYFTTVKFNPAHITEISLDPSVDINGTVGRIKVKLSSKTAKTNIKMVGTYEKFEGSCIYMDELSNTDSMNGELYIYFMQADNTNFNKLKKALEHLRDLLKAEDDPFGG